MSNLIDIFIRNSAAMKKIIIVLLIVSASAQGYSQIWNTNVDEAVREASKTNKKVLLFFSVSEQCDNCISLEKNVFKTPEFSSFASANYILVKLDFSQKPAGGLTEEMIENNLLIVEKYNKDGFFPLVVVLNKNAKVLGKTGIYKQETPLQFINLLESFEKA